MDQTAEASNKTTDNYGSESHQARPNHYKMIRRIGRGTHGTVYLAKDVTTGDRVAIKAVKRRDKRQDRHRQLLERSQKRSAKTPIVNNITNSNELKIRREVALMRRLDHPHVLRLVEVLDDPLETKVYIVLEYLEGGDVIWFTHDKAPVQTVLQSTRIIRDVMLGLLYLHNLGIVHRDIKPANLLFTQDRATVKISDFGVSIMTSAAYHRRGDTVEEEDTEFQTLMNDDFLNRLGGTPAFLAPELCWKSEDLMSDTASTTPDTVSSVEPAQPAPRHLIDVWALGVTFYCLLFGRIPWEGDNEWQMYNRIVEDDFFVPKTMGCDQIPTGGRMPKSERDFPDGYHAMKLLSGLLTKDPHQRLTLQEMKKMPYVLKDIRYPDLWQRNTDLQAGLTINITEEDTRSAVTAVRWRTKVAMGISRLKANLARPPTTPVIRSQSLRPTVRRAAASSCTSNQGQTSAAGVSSAYLSQPIAGPSTFPHLVAERTAKTFNVSTPQLLRAKTGNESSSLDHRGVVQKMREFGGHIRTTLGRPHHSDGQYARLSTNRARHSEDAWHASRDIMSTSEMMLQGRSNRRRVLSDGDEDDEGSEANWSSDDYGETEHERMQRLLVGAGGVDQVSSQSSSQPSPSRNNAPAVRNVNEAIERAKSPLRNRAEDDADDEDEDDDETSSGSEEVNGDEPEQSHSRHHSVYSGSEPSESDSDCQDQLAPVELRVRRTAPTPNNEDRMRAS